MADSPKVRPFYDNIMKGVYDYSPDMWPTAYKEYRKQDTNEDPLAYSAWQELRDATPKPLTYTLTMPLSESATIGDITAALHRLARNIEDTYGDNAYPFAGQGGHIMLRHGQPESPVGRWGVDTAE